MMNDVRQVVERLRFYAEYGMTLLQKGGATALAREAADALEALTAQPSEVERLKGELAAAQQTNREWLAANGPGGWIDDLRLSRTSPPAPSGWQPIESAPNPTESTPHNSIEWKSFLVWVESNACTYCVVRRGGKFDVMGGGLLQHEPTHWMPLPSGPGQHAKDARPPVAEASPVCAYCGDGGVIPTKDGLFCATCYHPLEADASPAKDPIADAVHADLAPLASELIDMGHKLAKETH